MGDEVWRDVLGLGNGSPGDGGDDVHRGINVPFTGLCPENCHTGPLSQLACQNDRVTLKSDPVAEIHHRQHPASSDSHGGRQRRRCGSISHGSGPLCDGNYSYLSRLEFKVFTSKVALGSFGVRFQDPQVR